MEWPALNICPFALDYKSDSIIDKTNIIECCPYKLARNHNIGSYATTHCVAKL